jgi:adenosylmethionine-8-amino-7-oxononanoate aminotransferase
VRVLGAIGVVELEKEVNMAELQPMLVDAGIWLRPFGKLLYTMPPYIADRKDIGQLTAAMVSVLGSYLGA